MKKLLYNKKNNNLQSNNIKKNKNASINKKKIYKYN
jgi:hypothetical protein